MIRRCSCLTGKGFFCTCNRSSLLRLKHCQSLTQVDKSQQQKNKKNNNKKTKNKAVTVTVTDCRRKTLVPNGETISCRLPHKAPFIWPLNMKLEQKRLLSRKSSAITVYTAFPKWLPESHFAVFSLVFLCSRTLRIASCEHFVSLLRRGEVKQNPPPQTETEKRGWSVQVVHSTLPRVVRWKKARVLSFLPTG